MKIGFNRRQFLAASGAIAAAGAAPNILLAGQPGLLPREESLFKISLAEWSLHRALKGGKIDNLDFPRIAKEEFGIEGVEYVNQFFKDKATDFAYLGEMKKRADDSGVRSLLIMVDGEGSLAAEDDSARQKAIANHYKWIVASAYLGGHSIRVNAAGSGDPEEMKRRAAESLVTLADFGRQYGISVIVENHGGWSSNGAWLADVMRIADDPGVGTLPDFGNFHLGGGKQYDRYKGVTELMPYAKAVSAKSHDFDEGGNEIHTDYTKMMKIVHDAGYRGFVGVEYEGGKHSEDEGIELTKKLLERVRGAMG